MFDLTKEQKEKLDAWLEEILPEISKTTPYYGAVGGGLTYSFTLTGLGVVVEVTEYHTKKTINLTDYDSW
jgi:hypothetical protein